MKYILILFSCLILSLSIYFYSLVINPIEIKINTVNTINGYCIDCHNTNVHTMNDTMIQYSTYIPIINIGTNYMDALNSNPIIILHIKVD